jgi:hypothetical protein
MRVPSSILLLLSGATAGTAFVISCGDNWHLATDAPIDAHAVTDAAEGCDCPTAEPPLAGRFMLVNHFRPMSGNTEAASRLYCPVGTQLIWGSCTIENPTTINNVILKEAGFFDVPPTSWRCYYRNDDPTTLTYQVAVLCLKPAP